MDLYHDLTFYCTHNQLCVPQYKVNDYLEYLGCITFTLRPSGTLLFNVLPMIILFDRKISILSKTTKKFVNLQQFKGALCDLTEKKLLPSNKTFQLICRPLR